MLQALSQRQRSRHETRVLKMLAQGDSMAEVLNEICHVIDAKSPGVIPTVLLLDDDGLHLRLAAGPKVPTIWSEAFNGLKVPSYDALDNHAEHAKRSVPFADVKSHPSFAAFWGRTLGQGIKAAWSVPILSKRKKVLGTLILFCPTSQPPGDRELEVVEQATHIAAIAIEYHRKEEELHDLSRRLYQSQDQERRRIARELHDSTGQKLAVLGLNLAIGRAALVKQPSESDKTLLECESLIRNISDELRTLSYLLHPPLLDECGLNLAVQWYVSGINQRNGLHVEIELPDEPRRLSDEAELAVFRIVQASLTNVHLHSEASKAKVQLAQTLDGVVVTISDDGHGIPAGVLDHSSPTKTVGVGITGMRERVEQLGGRLEIKTGRHGTKVEATIPKHHFRPIT
jgi:signal transduction histidine kinase